LKDSGFVSFYHRRVINFLFRKKKLSLRPTLKNNFGKKSTVGAAELQLRLAGSGAAWAQAWTTTAGGMG